MGDKISAQATQSRSFKSGGLRAHHAATGDTSSLPPAYGKTGASAFPHLCKKRSIGALSPKNAPVLGWRPLNRRLRNHAPLSPAFALLSHAPPCVCSAAHTIEERGGPMERSRDDVAMPLLRFEPEPVAVFNVLFIWALPWGWFVSLAPSLRHSGA